MATTKRKLDFAQVKALSILGASLGLFWAAPRPRPLRQDQIDLLRMAMPELFDAVRRVPAPRASGRVTGRV